MGQSAISKFQKCPKWKTLIFFPHTFQNKIFFPIPILPISETGIDTQSCYSSLIMSFFLPLPIHPKVLHLSYIF